MDTWRNLITKVMQQYSESWDDVVGCTLSGKALDEKFAATSYGIDGQPFTLWTKYRVYFPVTYDGTEWVDSVARHPCIESKYHVG